MVAILEDFAQRVRVLENGGGVGAGALLARNNLSDLADLVLARANLGLGNSATQDVGSTAGTVAAGDDPRFGTGASGFSGAPYPTLSESLAGVHIPAGSLDRLRTNPKPGQWVVAVALTASLSDNQVWIPGSEDPYPTPPAEEVPGEVVGVAFNFPQKSTFVIQIGNETLLVRGGNGTYFSQVPNATFYDALPSSQFPITITPGHMHPHIGSGGGSFHTPEGYLIGYTAYTPTSATSGYFTVNTAPHIASIPPGYWCEVPWHVARAQNGTTLAAHGIGSVIQTTATRTIVAVGDSITFGTDTPESFVDFMRRALSIPYLGMGYRGVWALEWAYTLTSGTGWSAIASGSTYDYFPWNDATLTTTHGIYGQVSTTGGHAGDHATYTPRPDQGTIETLEFVWLDTPTSGDMSYQWNGAGGWTTIQSLNPAAPMLRRTEVVVPGVFNSVTVRAAPSNGTPNGTCYFGGCINHAIATYTNVGQVAGNGLNQFAATGTLVHNIAAGGNELGVLVRSGSGDSLRFLDGDAASLYPDLIVVGTFTNDYPLSTDPTTYFIPALQALRDRSAGYADMLIVLSYENNRLAAGPTHATYQTQMDYRNAVKAWAVTNNVAVVDLFEAWAAWLGYDPTDATGVGWAAANAASLLYDGLIHANQAAQIDIGNRLNRALNANGPLVSPQSPPLNFDTANNFLINAIPNVLQTNVPNYISSENSFSNVINMTGIGSAGAQLDFVHWSGTQAAPTLTPAGTVMSYVGTFGYTGSNNTYGAAIQVSAEEDYGSSNAGATRMDFYTKKSATSGLQYGMALDNAGHLYGAPTVTSNHVSGYAWKLGYTGDVAAVSYFAAGKTGATQDTTWIGGTPSGAPTIASPTAGMFAIGLDATLWVYDGSTWNSNNVGGSGSGTFPKVIINGTISSGTTFKSLTEQKAIGATTALTQFTHLEINDPTLVTTTGAPYTRALAGVNWSSGVSNIFSTANSFTSADVGSSITLGAVTTTITSFSNAGVVGIDPAHLPATTQGTDVPKTVTRGTTATGYTGTTSTGSLTNQTGLWVHALAAGSGTKIGIQNDADSLLGGTTTLNNVVINGTYSGPSGTLVAPFPTLGQQYAGIHIPPGGLDRYGQRSRPASTWLWNSINNSTDTLVRPYNFALFPTVDWTRFRKPLDWVASTPYSFNDRVSVSGAWWRCVTANSDATFTSGNWLRIGPAWISGTAYKVNDLVWVSGIYYRCVANVSGSTTPGSDIYAAGFTSNHWQIDRNPAAHTIILDSEEMVVQHGNGFVSVAAASNGVDPTAFAGSGVIHVSGVGDIDPAPPGGTGSLNLSANSFLGSGPLVITYTGLALSGTDWTITGCTFVSGTGGNLTTGDEVRQGDANGMIWTVVRASNGTTIAAHTGYASSTSAASVITTRSTDHWMVVGDSIAYGVSSPNPTGTYKSAESEGWTDRLRQIVAQPNLGAGIRSLARADEWTDTRNTWIEITPNTAATDVFPFANMSFFWSGKVGTTTNVATGCTVTNGSSSIAKTGHGFATNDIVTVISSANFPSTSASAFYVATNIDANHFSLKLFGGSAIVATSSESITVQMLDTYEWVPPADQPCAGRFGIMWCDNSDAGTFYYRVNGGAWQSVTVNASVGVARYSEISYPGAINTIDILPPSDSSKSVYLGGVVSFNTGPGVVGTLFSQIGFVGQSLGQYQGNDLGLVRTTAGDSFAYFSARGGSLEPSLVILECTNDLNNIGWSTLPTTSGTANSVVSRYCAALDMFRDRVGAHTDIVLVCSYYQQRSGVSEAAQLAFWQAVQAHALRIGIVCVNIQEAWANLGINSWADSAAYGFMPNPANIGGPHPTQLGHQSIASIVARALELGSPVQTRQPDPILDRFGNAQILGSQTVLGNGAINGNLLVGGYQVLGGAQVVVGTITPTGGFAPPATSTAASIPLRGLGVYYASDYGIVADNTTDCGAALNALILKISLAGGGTLYLPPGPNNMMTSTTIVGQSGVYITSANRAISAIALLPASNCDLYRQSLGQVSGGLYNLRLTGRKAGQAADDYHHGINASHSWKRTVTVTISGGTTATATSGSFTYADHGAAVTGTGIPAGTTITYVSSTVVTLSQTSTNASGIAAALAVPVAPMESACTYSDIVLKLCSGDGYHGKDDNYVGPSTNALIRCWITSCNGYGIRAGVDTQVTACSVEYCGLTGVVGSGISQQVVGTKSCNNGLNPWWDGTAIAYNAGTTYHLGNGVIAGSGTHAGVVYVANNEITAGSGDPHLDTNSGASGQANQWIPLVAGQPFTYSSTLTTIATKVSSCAYYMANADVTADFTTAAAAITAITTGGLTGIVPLGGGFLNYGNSAGGYENAWTGCDAQNNSGSSYYLLNCTGMVIQGTSNTPGSNPLTLYNRLKNPFNTASVTLDHSSGNTVQVASVQLNAGATQSGTAGTQNSDSVNVLYITTATPLSTRNNLILSGDGSGVEPTLATIGSGNSVVYNGQAWGDNAAYNVALQVPQINDALGAKALTIANTAGTVSTRRFAFFDATSGGGPILGLYQGGSTTPENYLAVFNAGSGVAPAITAAAKNGLDTDVTIGMFPIGQGVVRSGTGFQVDGMTGARNTSRFVGSTATGAPSSGSWLIRDWSIAADGHLWICTASGSPGTWVDAGTSGGSGSYQPLDSDLTTIAGLTATTDNFLVSVASAWASRTPAQVRTTLGLVIGTNVQAWDADLDTYAGITPGALGQAILPMTTLTNHGLVLGAGASAPTALALDSSTTKYLQSGGSSAAPAWAALAASDIASGTLAVAQGGTNLASYAVGDLLYASGTTTLAKLADVATGSVLVSGGVTTAPAWSSSPTFTALTLSGTGTNLTTNQDAAIGRDAQVGRNFNVVGNITSVTGTSAFGGAVSITAGGTGLAVTNGITAASIALTTALSATSGGTGLSTFTTGDILYASASNTLSALAKGTSGTVLTQGASIQSWVAMPAPVMQLPTSAIAASMDRLMPSGALAAQTSGTLYAVQMNFTAGQVVSSISMKTGATALTAGTGAHQWFGIGLITSGVPGVVQRWTADDTTTAWAAFTVKTLSLTTTYTIPTTGAYYIYIMIAAGSGGVMPVIIGNPNASTNILNLPPIVAGATTDTGLTTPPALPFTPGSVTSSANVPYVYAS